MLFSSLEDFIGLINGLTRLMGSGEKEGYTSPPVVFVNKFHPKKVMRIDLEMINACFLCYNEYDI